MNHERRTRHGVGSPQLASPIAPHQITVAEVECIFVQRPTLSDGQQSRKRKTNSFSKSVCIQSKILRTLPTGNVNFNQRQVKTMTATRGDTYFFIMPHQQPTKNTTFWLGCPNHFQVCNRERNVETWYFYKRAAGVVR